MNTTKAEKSGMQSSLPYPGKHPGLSQLTFLLILLVSLVGLSFSLPLFDLDEGAFTEATREILASGNWASTYLNGVPRYDKPILIYWLQASSVLLFGLNELSLRLPSILAGALWIWATFRFVRDFISTEVARFAVLILACNLVATVIFKAAIADALLNLFLSLSFFSIFRYCRQPATATLFRTGCFLGLGFLTKGPVAVLLPVVSSLIALGLARQLPLWWRAVSHPVSWLTFLVIITPWHIAVYLDQGWDFFKGFYLGHNLGRFSNTMESHGGSVFYYLLLLPVLVIPFTGPLFRLAMQAVRQGKVCSLSLFRSADHPELASACFLTLFLSSWFFLTLVLFSFSNTQLPHYLLYGLSPLFILLARWLADHPARRSDLMLGLVPVLLIVLLPLAFGPILANSRMSVYDAAVLQLAAEIFQSSLYFWMTLGFALLAIIIALIPTNPKVKLFGLSICLMLNLNFITLPLVAQAQQTPVKMAAQWVTESGLPVMNYRINMPSFSVYTQRVITSDQTPAAGMLVLTKTGHGPDLEASLPGDLVAEQVFQRGGIMLYRLEATQ